MLDCIAELQARLPETASRVRQRLEVVFDDAEFRGLCTGNPARAIRRKLKDVAKKRKRGNHAALPYAKAPAFLRELRGRVGIAARALEFGMLTAARTDEMIGAGDAEFDLERGFGSIPAARMKGGEDHVVFLSRRAMASLRSRWPRSDLRFSVAGARRQAAQQHGDAYAAATDGCGQGDDGARSLSGYVQHLGI